MTGYTCSSVLLLYGLSLCFASSLQRHSERRSSEQAQIRTGFLWVSGRTSLRSSATRSSTGCCRSSPGNRLAVLETQKISWAKGFFLLYFVFFSIFVFRLQFMQSLFPFKFHLLILSFFSPFSPVRGTVWRFPPDWSTLMQSRPLSLCNLIPINGDEFFVFFSYIH